LKKQPQILVLTTTFPRWRGDPDPPFVFELCRRLAKDFGITVLAPHYPGSPSAENMDGIRVVRFRYFFEPWEKLAYGSGGGILARIRINPFWGLMIPFLVAGQVLAALILLRRERFDLIHAHWLLPQALTVIIARVLSGRELPLLATAHGGDLYGLRGRLMDRLRGFVLSQTAAVTVVSRAMAEDLVRAGVPPEKVRVIPMGTDLTGLFCPGEAPRDPKQVLFVGRLVEKKGCRYLIEAWRKVIERKAEARLLIVGDGPERERLERRAVETKTEGSIRFLGALPQASLPDLYRSSAVVVFPSVVGRGGDREGFGLVPVEALGCECAVVVTDLPAMRDIVQDGETGLVVRRESSEEIAGAVLRLLKAPAFSRRLGQNGRRYALGRFEWGIIGKRYGDLIDLSIGGRGRL
jgi:glycosyltransferase involved in cell wall biosynthesis